MPGPLASIEVVGDLGRLDEIDVGRFIEAPLASVSFLGGQLHLGDHDRDLAIDDEGMRAIEALFGLPQDFSRRLPVALRSEMWEWFRNENIEGKVLVEQQAEFVVGMWNGERPMIPRGEIAKVIQRVMPAEAKVRSIDITQGKLLVDIVTDEVAVAPRQGDISLGGLRVYSHIAPSRGKKQQPRVASFWERLLCTNGMTRTEETGRITLRGNTVDDVIDEMEKAARRIWGDVVPYRLEQYAHLADLPVDDTSKLLHRLARENGIGEKIETAALDEISTMEGNTLYDIVNLVSGFQHRDGVRGTQFDRLQEMPGNVAATHDRARCPACLTALE